MKPSRSNYPLLHPHYRNIQRKFSGKRKKVDYVRARALTQPIDISKSMLEQGADVVAGNDKDGSCAGGERYR